jgi:hypothetical protein
MSDQSEEERVLVRALYASFKYALVVETEGKVVITFRPGRVPSVEYVEGCL